MGTGIVANASAVLPGHARGLRAAATLVWVLAAAWLAVLVAGSAVQGVRHRHLMRGHLRDVVMAPFHGAIPMALMTVGAGTLVFGRDLLGTGPAVGVSAALWITGTVLGLVSVVVVPYVMVTSHRPGLAQVRPAWLMAVVPPMVSATTAAALVPHLPAGQPRVTLVLAGWGLFGVTVLAMVPLLPLVWASLVRHGAGPAATVPTLWIVLGPLGQSVTAAGVLGLAGRGVLPAPFDTVFAAVALVYGLPVFTLALLWMALAAVVTARTARTRGLPFAMTWWSFTFPVGTCVTGAAALRARLDAVVLDVLTVALFALLVTAWGVVAVRTARGVADGRLLPRP
jgi:C4-dicarboxylate transporter/malic acid transport protein